MIAAAVIVAGALGAVVRYLVSRWLSSAEGAYRNLPLAVLIVNVVGSAIGGAVLGLATAGGVDAGIRLVLLTGLCGGLTTFSTFSVETVQYVTEGKWRIALASV
ncbi:MAG TPA: CrcB family protein, partial [Rhodoglobus sp.]|nr:CrcB family protein [Rhodoglobus sp.]